jgi:ubiquinone/menaquinone biosynthesis C-methylase UbiE
MDEFDERENAERTGFGRPGYPQQYHAVRPRLPVAVADLLCQYARCQRPRLVVDLGCGTGLSTQVWIDRAETVVGIEPLAPMLALARASVRGANVRWLHGYAHDTRLADGAADIVVCSQSFHWMEPQTTLREAARILRDGGVFAAVDCDKPAVDWEVETIADRFSIRARAKRDELGIRVGADQARGWPKDGHLQQMRDSGWFDYVRGVFLHQAEAIAGERMVEETINVVVDFLPELTAAGIRAEEIGLDEFRDVCARRIGAAGRWFLGYQVRLGVRKAR